MDVTIPFVNRLCKSLFEHGTVAKLIIHHLWITCEKQNTPMLHNTATGVFLQSSPEDYWFGFFIKLFHCKQSLAMSFAGMKVTFR